MEHHGEPRASFPKSFSDSTSNDIQSDSLPVPPHTTSTDSWKCSSVRWWTFRAQRPPKRHLRWSSSSRHFDTRKSASSKLKIKLISRFQPHNFCPAYDAISGDTSERDAFEQGPEYEQMMDQVNAKLGFTGSNRLTNEQVRTIWDWCRFEQTSQPSQPAAFCAAFSMANHEVLNYYKDLAYYYNQGYGTPNRRLVENLNCGLMQNLLNALQSQSSTQGRLRIFGAHTNTLQLFWVMMGAFEDDFGPTRHNFAQQALRLWRTGLISSKGSNLAMIRFEWVDDNIKKNLTKKMIFRLQLRRWRQWSYFLHERKAFADSWLSNEWSLQGQHNRRALQSLLECQLRGSFLQL